MRGDNGLGWAGRSEQTGRKRGLACWNKASGIKVFSTLAFISLKPPP